MPSLVWLIGLLALATLVEVQVEAAGSVTVEPDTIAAGEKPTYWNVTVSDMPVMKAGSWSSFTVTTSKTVFNEKANPRLILPIAGCNFTASYILTISMSLNVPHTCGLNSSFSFIIPTSYLSINPGGNVSVSINIGSNYLKTYIEYTPDSPSPSASPKRPSPSPATPGPPPALSVAPDVLDSGAQPSYWNVTVDYFPPMESWWTKTLWLSSTADAFNTISNSVAFIDVSGCNCTAQSVLRSLSVKLPDNCVLGSSFSYVIPLAYLLTNPGGNVNVSFSLGTYYMKTTVPFTAASTSPSPSILPSPSATPSHSPSPASRSPSPSRSPSRSPSPSPTTPSPSPSVSPSPVSPSPESSPSPKSSPSPSASPAASPSPVPSPITIPGPESFPVSATIAIAVLASVLVLGGAVLGALLVMKVLHIGSGAQAAWEDPALQPVVNRQHYGESEVAEKLSSVWDLPNNTPSATPAGAGTIP
eukprot:EG_transcript_7560